MIKNTPHQLIFPEYILFDGLAPSLSHVSHVMALPEPRCGHANYGRERVRAGQGTSQMQMRGSNIILRDAFKKKNGKKSDIVQKGRGG